MQMLTILMLVRDNSHNAKYAIESIRMLNDIEGLQLVVVNNGDDKEFHIWCQEQQDFTYVYMDGEKEKEGKVINDVIRELQINTHLLITDGNMLILPNTLGNMLEKLQSDEEIGAVGGRSNIYVGNQKFAEAKDYSSAVEYCSSLIEKDDAQVLGLYPEAILFNAKMPEKLGEFDEQLDGLSYVLRDFLLRLVINDYKLVVSGNAVFWGLQTEEASYESEAAAILEQKWGMHYFNFVGNGNLVSLVNEKKETCFDVLEIGCDCGATLMDIKNVYPNAGIYGTDINESAINIARHIATVSVDNIEECNLDYPEGKFKYILFGDVLEHLRNPLDVLKYCKTLLGDDGKIIASIPNLMHISVVDDLLRGNFTYTETGLLDKTHIHFFTFREIEKMLSEAGYSDIDIFFVKLALTEEQGKTIEKIREIYRDTPEYMFSTFQYLVSAKKLS